MPELTNIADILPLRAEQLGDRPAIRCPGSKGPDGFARYDEVISYADLDRRSHLLALGFQAYGIGRGQRAVVMLKPSIDFFLVMFALFKAGAVPVLVDPGIARSALKQCLREAEPQAFIGIPLAQAAKLLLRWAPDVRQKVTAGRFAYFGGTTLAAIEALGRSSRRDLPEVDGEDPAAILFTSGSTGVPKGVLYRHRHFTAQVRLLQQAFAVEPGGVSLPTFPPFALFDPALGLTSIIPDMDPRRPGSADPEKLLHAITTFGVTQLFGSPALMAVLAKHGKALPGLCCVISAGAPVPADTVEKIQSLCEAQARFWTPYGATECLPVAVIDGEQLAQTRAGTDQGFGTCVGMALPDNTVRLIGIDDEAIAEWNDDLCVPQGDIGEVTVAGPSATDSYYRREASNRLGKIHETLADGSTRIVHRMGDLAWQDTQGRLWFCGRKSQRLQTRQGLLGTENVEPIFNRHPAVKRSALVGLGAYGEQQPVLCIEREPDATVSDSVLCSELLSIASQHRHTRQIQIVLFHPGFPVDIRHNAKIGREQLTAWAAKRLAKRV
ncbi:MAG: fatty acid CoA ligase family protein [Arenimonas sp.]|uniref:fatty acid CoA ligase family protein n=1 Tax=Arenimonas sp. TaxID=1872635 RepID=UPI003C0D5746